MKTIREHLNELPEPYRTEALENMNQQPYVDIKQKISAADALQSAFYWSDSPQDHDYWEKFQETL